MHALALPQHRIGDLDRAVGPDQAASVDTEVLEWIASQMRGKRRSNRTLLSLVATIVGAATLPLAQLPNVFDIGL